MIETTELAVAVPIQRNDGENLSNAGQSLASKVSWIPETPLVMEAQVRHSSLLVLFTLLSLSTAFGDQVTLKNGDRLSGTVAQSDGKTLTLHTDYAGDISIKWDAVQGVESKEGLHLELKDGKTLAGPVTASDGKLQVATNSGNVETSISDIKTLRGSK